jgi:hypothetical protein
MPDLPEVAHEVTAAGRCSNGRELLDNRGGLAVAVAVNASKYPLVSASSPAETGVEAPGLQSPIRGLLDTVRSAAGGPGRILDH